jgi:hypothetical protein
MKRKEQNHSRFIPTTTKQNGRSYEYLSCSRPCWAGPRRNGRARLDRGNPTSHNCPTKSPSPPSPCPQVIRFTATSTQRSGVSDNCNTSHWPVDFSHFHFGISCPALRFPSVRKHLVLLALSGRCVFRVRTHLPLGSQVGTTWR